MQIRRRVSRRPRLSRRRCVARLAVGGLAAVGALYGLSQTTGGAIAQDVEPEPAAPARQPKQVGKAGFGTVTAIASEPAGFTAQMTDGQLVTYRVLDRTVFTGGRDRPYNFALLKVGDTVRVKGGGPGPKAKDNPGNDGQPGAARTRPGRAGQVDGLPVARKVIVRPAGERRPGAPARSAGQPDGGRRESDGVL